MKITCHSCSAKYTVSDEKVQGKTVKMKCRKCGATIVVGAATQAEGVHADDGAGEAGADAPPPGSYLVSISDADQRTMTLAEVVEAYNSGVITAETYVFTDGMSDWQALAENEAIVAALNEAASASAALSGAVMGEANGANAGYAPASYSNPAPSPVQHGMGQQGMGTQQIAAMAPASDAKPAVAARRDGNRKSADLFGGGGGGFGTTESSPGYSSASALASSSSVSGSTGKREENSVLFSLNALTAATPAPARVSSTSATTATKEDSGLIDLKALSANAPPQPAAAAATAPVIDSIGLFPLGAPVMAPPSPTGVGYAGPAVAEPRKSSKIGLVIGGVIAVCAVIGVFVLVSGKTEDKTNASNSPTQTATATATAIAQASSPTTGPATSNDAAPTDSLAMAGTDSPSGSVSATAKPRYTGPGRPRTKETGGSPGPGPAGNTAKPAAAQPCGCKPGDVDCMIKCQMKGKK